MNLFRDLGYGLRQIVRRPLFSVVIVLTLALGIGPNVAIFSVLKALVIEPLPYPEPERLMQVWQTDIDGRWSQPFSYPDFLDIREQSESFEHFTMHWPHSFNLGGEEPERVLGSHITAGGLAVWGIPPAHGRLFTDEEVEGEERLVVLADALWKRRYGGDPDIVERSVIIDGEPYQVIGVMPQGFEYYTPWTDGQEVALWVPLQVPDWSNRGGHWLLGVARLKPGVDWRSAEAEIRGIASRLQKEYPDTNARTQAWLQPFLLEVIGGMGGPFLILISAVGFVLLTACANVAGMLLARGSDRKTEVAVRGCMGAGKFRLIIQLLTENSMLSLLGGGCGILLSVWSVDLIKSIIPSEVPRVHGIEVDPGVLLFAVLLTMITALLFGLVPALVAASTDIASTLREGSGSVTSTKRRNRVLRLLAIGQIAVAFILTNGAILLYTSYRNVLDEEFAFDRMNTIAARVALADGKYETTEERVVFWDNLIERLENVPGVEHVSITTKLPMEGGTNTTVLAEDESYDARVRRRLVERSWISPGYFEAMGIPLLTGRVFDADEGTNEARMVVVNQAMVERYWPDENPIGQVIRQNSPQPEWTATIVGVVADVPQWGPTYPPLAEMYMPYRLGAHRDSFIVVRAAKDPHALVPVIQNEVLRLDENLPLAEARTMQDVIIEKTRGRQFLLRLISMFAVIAMFLAMVGIFGTMSHNVAQRTREIGIRVAFGAHRRRILQMVLWDGLILSLVGIAAGFFMLWVFVGILGSQLYGVGAVNLLYGGMTSLMLVGVTVLAATLPALRAGRVDPMQSLRFE